MYICTGISTLINFNAHHSLTLMSFQVTPFASPLHIYSCSAFGKHCVPVCFYVCSQESATQGSEDTKQVCVFELVLQSGVAFVIFIISFAYSICTVVIKSSKP